MTFRLSPTTQQVRRVLLWLALACLLPGVLGAAALMAYQHLESRHQLEQQTVLTARALVQAVDHHLLMVQAAAQALSHSESLARGDLAAFHRQGRSTMEQLGLGTNIVLRDRAGRQLLNTAVDFGQPLNVPPEPLQVEAVFETGRPVIANLFIGPVLKRPLMSVDVPVMIDGRVAYSLGIGVLPEHFNDILRNQNLPTDWFTGVLDQNGTFVGRTRQPELFVGRRGSPSLLRQLDLLMEGAGETTTVEGAPVVSFHSRSAVTGWTVAIGIPQASMVQGLRRTSGLLAAVMVVLFAAGCLLAWLIGGRIARSFQALSVLASSLGRGQAVAAPQLPITEAAETAAAMERAATTLEEREATLKESEARFKALADNMAQLAWMTDRHGQVLWFNRRWYEYTGGNAQDLVDHQWLDRLQADHAARARQLLEQHIRDGRAWEDTFLIRGRHGELRWFLCSVMPLHDRAGRITNWFGTNTDITPQLETQHALHEAHARKDEFISILAHELRNPLAPVRTAVEILQRLGPMEPRLARARTVIERQVAHMARLIDDLLDVARIANGKLALHLEACDLALIARQTAEDYQLSMEAAGLDLRIRTPARALWVQGDAVRLAQMIGNLLNNAARFTERGGQVEVRAEADEAGGRALVHVIDTGVGISAELMQRLFDPFSQAAQDLARSKGGLGLGLALTKGLVELQGGTLAVHSEGPGHGSRFTLSLPLQAQAPAPDRPPAHGTAPARPRPRRVLVIEDNQDAARSLGELLELAGNEVQLAFDGTSGVEAAHRFAPEVVISDIGLPGGADGYAVARQMRAAEDLKDVYLIALSGYTDEQARRQAREAGFDRYLFKPVNVVELEDALDALPA